jgi:Tfp pilus assembly protein PilV
MSPLRQKLPAGEAGFALIEVVVSAAVLLVASAGTFGLLNAMTKASGDQRHRAQAYAIAQEDQARLRSIRLTALKHLDEIREVPLGGTIFRVHSTGVFVNDKTAKVSCTSKADSSADYAQVTSEVTWTGMTKGQKTMLRSIVSPSNSSIDSNHGTLTVAIANEKGVPKAGIDLEVGLFSNTTNAEGCANFPDLANGSYMLKSMGEDAAMVGTNSNYLEETLVGVPIERVELVKLTYDSPGWIPVKFKYRVGSTGTYEAASADSVVAFHSTMKAAKVLGTPGGARVPLLKAVDLFPFSSPYSVYAGTCEKNNPGTGAGLTSATVPAGNTSEEVTLQLPALDLTVKNGSTLVQGAKVTITDKECKDLSGNPVKRFYTTNVSGKQITPGSLTPEKPEPALPWGSYEVCASAKIGTVFKRKKSSVTVQNLANTTALTIDLSSGASEGVECT